MDPGFLCLGGWFEVVRKWNYAGSSVTRVDAVGGTAALCRSEGFPMSSL